jgi:hypothetical protein
MRIVNDPNSPKLSKSVSQRIAKYDIQDLDTARKLFFNFEPKTALRWILEITDESGNAVMTLPSGMVQDLRGDPNGSGVWFLL